MEFLIPKLGVILVLLKGVQIGVVVVALLILLYLIISNWYEGLPVGSIKNIMASAVVLYFLIMIPILLIEKYQPQAARPWVSDYVPSDGVRLQVFRDSNGCQYLGFSNLISLTPRLGPDGKQMGCRETKEQRN